MCYTGVEVARQRLIYRGRILRDTQVISDIQIHEGDCVHMVKGRIQPAPASSPTAAAPPAATTTTPPAPAPPAAAAGAVNPFAAGMNPFAMFGGMPGGGAGGNFQQQHVEK